MTVGRKRKARMPYRSKRERGQAAVLAALLIVFVVLAVAALAIGAGANFDNQQALQSAADLAALAGAQETGFAPAAVLGDTEALAWDNLKASPTSSLCTSASTSPCTETGDGYSVTVTYPYQYPYQLKASAGYPYAAKETVAVAITHQNPQIGFAGFLGIHNVAIGVKAAATAGSSPRQFPFALATRFLDLVGTGTAAAYGSVLIDQCSDNGAGDFYNTGGNNGGFAYNGGATLEVGSAVTGPGSNSLYTNASAVLVADGRPGAPGSACSNPPNKNVVDASSTWNNIGDQVNFDAGGGEYNYGYGFNSGPTGCQSPPSPTTSCQSNPEGMYGTPGAKGYWQDSCWTNTNGGSGVFPLVPVESIAQEYVASSNSFSPPTVPAGVPCSNYSPPGSLEGSFYQSQFPGFPSYQNPLTLASELASSGDGTMASPGSVSQSGNAWSFSPGIYTFSGQSQSIAIKNGSFTCDNTSAVYPNGCIFVFEQGAGLSVSGTSQSHGSQITCNGCAFYFMDSTAGSPSAFQISGSNVSGSITPIQYCPPLDAPCGSTPLANFPVVYSNNVATAVPPLSSLANDAVISFTSSGSLAIDGTIFVPHGIYDSNSNANELTGQVIADTFRLQSGSAAIPTGVSYSYSTAALELSPSFLIQ